MQIVTVNPALTVLNIPARECTLVAVSDLPRRNLSHHACLVNVYHEMHGAQDSVLAFLRGKACMEVLRSRVAE